MTVLENLLIGRHARIVASLLTEMFFLPGLRREELMHGEAVEKILTFVGLEAQRRRPVGALPFGVQKLVGFARALARTVKFKVNERAGIIGYKTGSIEGVKDVHAWVNPENSDMMMDRFMGKSIWQKSDTSAPIRNDEDDTVIEDTIQESLRGAVGERAHVRLGTVLVTEPGMLAVTHNVKLLFHVAAAEGGLGKSATVSAAKLKDFVKRVLATAPPF